MTNTTVRPKPSIQLWYGSTPRVGLDAYLAAAASAGFDDAVPSPAMVYEAIADGSMESVRARLSRGEIAISMIDPLISALPNTPGEDAVPPQFAEFFRYSAEDVFSAAESVGAGCVCLAAFLGEPAPFDETVRAVDSAVRRAAERGLRATIEFMPGGAIPDLAVALEIWRAVNHPQLSIAFDTWHFARTNGRTSEIESMPPESLGLIQVSDRIAPSPDEPYVPMNGRLLPGDGELPLVEWVIALRNLRPDLPVGIEVFSAEQRALPIAQATRKAADSIAALMDRVTAAA